jgi:small subunit ribosomal protein S3e
MHLRPPSQVTYDEMECQVRHVLLRQGVLGIKVKIMKSWDPTGQVGPKNPLPDVVTSAFYLLVPK